MAARPTRPATRQRSFRWSHRTLDALEQRARDLGDNPNSLAERLLSEGLRTERHALIGFRPDPHGPRRAALAGTRMHVWQVVQTIRASENDLDAAAEYLGLTRRQIQGVVDYYGEYREEIDADAKDAREFEERERERWERARQIFT